EFFPRFFERPDGAGIAIIRTVWIAMPVITFRPRAFLFHLVVIVTEIIQVLLCLLTVLLGPVTYLVHFPSAAGIVSNTLAASRGGHILQYARLFLIQRFTDFGRQDLALTKLLNHLFDCFAVGLRPEPFERRFDILHRNLSPTDRPNLYRRRSSAETQRDWQRILLCGALLPVLQRPDKFTDLNLIQLGIEIRVEIGLQNYTQSKRVGQIHPNRPA